MKLTTVLFDLDGTLLPMDQDEFVKAYFGLLAAKLAPHGYDPKKLMDGVWKGTGAMIRNDGSKTNEDAFWQVFTALFGDRVLEDKALFEEFYRTDFQKARSTCGFDPGAAEAILAIKALGLDTVMATNPIFPAVATERRIRWAGLAPEDFLLYTTYENSRYCKPNLDYYREILEKRNLRPEECLMVGNDVSEDMVARELGMEVFLLPACLINRENRDIICYPRGDFRDLVAGVESLVAERK